MLLSLSLSLSSMQENRHVSGLVDHSINNHEDSKRTALNENVRGQAKRYRRAELFDTHAPFLVSPIFLRLR